VLLQKGLVQLIELLFRFRAQIRPPADLRVPKRVVPVLVKSVSAFFAEATPCSMSSSAVI